MQAQQRTDNQPDQHHDIQDDQSHDTQVDQYHDIQVHEHHDIQVDQHRDNHADQRRDIQAEQHNSNEAAPRDMHLSSNLIRRYLLGDPAIKRAAVALGIDFDCRVVESLDWVRNFRVQRLHFELLAEDFDAWIARHGRLLGVHFGIIKRDYRCSRGLCRKNRARKGKGKEGGGEGGGGREEEETTPPQKKRRRRFPEPTGCKAEITSVRMEKRLEDGTVVQCHLICYMYHHNHALAVVDREENDGTQFLSVETRSTIERLLKQGESVREVLQRLQSCRKEITRQGGARVFRDDIFTYADLMDVQCQMANGIGRDEPEVSIPEETALDEPPEYHKQAHHEDVPAFHGEILDYPAQVCGDMLKVPMRLSETTKMTIRHGTLALLSELQSIGSISQLAEEDQDMVLYLRAVHRKLDSVSITMSTHHRRGEQQ
ncbi:hypothetical protein MVEG_03159 [Podila verticillata NRRL 6337]|nr:hypothetical protein MVEG_03159 [Podila verticillata NRRL 6337]